MSSKGFFSIGIIGFIMLMVYPILWEADWISFLPLLTGIEFFAILCLGIVLGAFIFFGLYREHRSQLSLVVFIISLIFPWIFFSGVMLNIFLGYTIFTEIVYGLGMELVGAVFLLWGSAMLVLRKEFGHSEFNLVSGMFFMLASWSFFAQYPLGSLYMIPACLVGIISLVQSEAFK